MSEGTFASPIGSAINRYLQLKRALGRRYAGEEQVLKSLDSFLTAEASDLTGDTFDRWCYTQEHLTSGVRRDRMRVVRNLCLYRRRTESACFVPDTLLFPPLHQPVQPYIFTETEIIRLFHAAGRLERLPVSPLRPELFRLALTLLYTTGLRRGELLRLTIGDYDPQERTLLVRESKFHKSRLLPLSTDASHELKDYLQARCAHRLPISPETPLIWNRGGGGRAYSGGGFWFALHRLFDKTKIRTPDGRLPRVHDLRHTFACHALLRWYRNEHDINAKLPLLAIYMGHVSIVSTQYYLHLIEPLATAANKRFERYCSGLVRPLASTSGGGR